MGLVQFIMGSNNPRGFVRPQDSERKTGKTGRVYLQLDAIVSENPEYIATPTTNTVEDGSEFSDHVLLAPEKVTLECVVTNARLPVGPIPTIGNIFKESDNLAREAYDFLIDLWEAREPFDIVTGLKTYTNMVIVSFSPGRNTQTGDALRFTVVLQKINVIQSETTLIPEIKVKTHSAVTEVNRGKQTPTEAAPAKVRRGSLAVELFKDLGVYTP